MLGQVIRGIEDTAQCLYTFGISLDRPPTTACGCAAVHSPALAVDVAERLAFLRVGDDHPVPGLAVAAGRRLRGQFQALTDHLYLDRAREIEPLAHGACGREDLI